VSLKPKGVRTWLRQCAAIALLTMPMLCQSGPAEAQDASGYPNKRLAWTISFGPGGGNDIMSRTLIQIIEKYKLYPTDIVAENRAGGSGAVGWGYLFSQKGNPYHISSTSGSFITTPLQANTPWKPADFTPIALLAADDLLLVVKGDSKITNLKEFIETAKQKPPASAASAPSTSTSSSRRSWRSRPGSSSSTSRSTRRANSPPGCSRTPSTP
jgi:putative tricarboxylic transport membrane protein